MKGFLAAAIGVLLVAGGLAVALDRRPTEVRDVRVEERALRPGQTEVTGVVTLFKADNAASPPGTLPVTIPKGAATLTGAVVNGARRTIVWDGGRPFVLHALSGGSLRMESSPVEIDAAGIRWTLDAGTNSFVPGRYRLATPVAVGGAGLASARDAVEFEADDTTRLAFRNTSVLTLPLAPVTLAGPGTVRIEGRLNQRTAEDERARGTGVVVLQGSYEATLTPGIDGLRVMGLFQEG